MSLVQSLSWPRIARQPIEHSKSLKESEPEPAGLGSDGVRSGYLGEEEKKRAGSYYNRVIGSVGRHASGAVILPRESGSWGDMLPELLSDIMRRVEESEDKWPQRQNFVTCGSVCKQWKEAISETVELAALRRPGLITLISSLKKSVEIWEMIRMIATARIVMPKAMVRLSAGRAKFSKPEHTLCFLAGANSIFTGNKLLTTPNNSYDADQKMFELLGLIPKAPDFSQAPETKVFESQIPGLEVSSSG